MNKLSIFSDADASRAQLRSDDPAEIRARLNQAGVRFERWRAGREIGPNDSHAEILAAYSSDIERLKREGGYQAVDVVHMWPGHPDRELARCKFLDEHRHAEDEVRFFVNGRGLFSLHVGERIFEVLCERGDLIGVPAGTPHWFDMGATPEFTAIRLFNNPEGWVAQFTGSSIASQFNRLDQE